VRTGTAGPVDGRQIHAVDRLAFEIEFDQNRRLIPYDPTLMAWLDCDELGSLYFLHAAVGEFNLDLTVRHEADVGVHAQFSTNDAAQVCGPVESRRVNHALDTNSATSGNIDLDAADLTVLSVS
jgi:hypothetical protein